MTVGENIHLGREPGASGLINWNKLYHKTQKVLDEYHLRINPSAVVSNLGVGQQQIVEIAKALSENAQVLILDEPTSALTEAEVEILMGILLNLKERGVTCLYISHKVEEFFRITDNITVLRDGGIVGTMPTKDANYEKVISMMVGREMKERFPTGTRSPGEVILEVRNLSVDSPYQTGKKAVEGGFLLPAQRGDPRYCRPHGVRPQRAGHDDFRRIRPEPHRRGALQRRSRGNRLSPRRHEQRDQPCPRGPQAYGARH